MSAAPLSRRALGRALLARQLLTARARMTPLEAVEHLVGLQAQAPKPPYFGLWSRLDGFDPEELSRLLQERKVVRIGVMRGTVHLVSDRDAVQLRPLTQVVYERGLRSSSHGKALGDTDPRLVADAARELLLARGPLGSRELGTLLAERWPDIGAQELSMTARYLLPVVQLPPRGLWGRSGNPVFQLVETWLGRRLAVEPCVETVVLRYLGAFGPASVRDAQTWSGLTRLKEVLERLRPQLRVFRDENGTELFDLPDAPRPDPELPVPARFVAEYDNLVLSHADRGRLMDDDVRSALATRNGQVPGTVLLDGRVRGIWKADTSRKAASLTVTHYGPLSKAERAELEEEGERLLAFAAAGEGHTVRFEAAG